MTELLTVPEAAQRLRVSVRHARRLIAAGRLRVVRLSPRVTRVKTTELDAFIAACSGRAA